MTTVNRVKCERLDVKRNHQNSTNDLVPGKTKFSPFKKESESGLKLLQKALTGFFILLLIPFALFAQDFPSRPTGHVNDLADMLSRGEQQQLEMKLRNYRDTTTNVIAIATLSDLQGYPIEEISSQLFNDWKMWHEDRYNGVLIVVAPNERQMRIEVGYGLEGAIPDVMAGRIIRNVLAPNFRQGNYYAGLDEASSILIQLAQGEYEGNLTQRRGSGEDDIASAIVFFLFLAFVIYTSTRRGGGGKNGGRRRRRTLGPAGFIFLGSGGFGGGSRGGGFGGGGFGGFSGGGGFGGGGGGASGGW